jgi:hypothetical protein
VTLQRRTVTLDTRDLSIIAQNAGTAAVGVYTHAVPEGTACV